MDLTSASAIPVDSDVTITIAGIDSTTTTTTSEEMCSTWCVAACVRGPQPRFERISYGVHRLKR
jgi:hypothetical protein